MLPLIEKRKLIVGKEKNIFTEYAVLDLFLSSHTILFSTVLSGNLGEKKHKWKISKFELRIDTY
jgi:hypothetical protein